MIPCCVTIKKVAFLATAAVSFAPAMVRSPSFARDATAPAPVSATVSLDRSSEVNEHDAGAYVVHVVASSAGADFTLMVRGPSWPDSGVGGSPLDLGPPVLTGAGTVAPPIAAPSPAPRRCVRGASASTASYVVHLPADAVADITVPFVFVRSSWLRAPLVSSFAISPDTSGGSTGFPLDVPELSDVSRLNSWISARRRGQVLAASSSKVMTDSSFRLVGEMYPPSQGKLRIVADPIFSASSQPIVLDTLTTGREGRFETRPLRVSARGSYQIRVVSLTGRSASGCGFSLKVSSVKRVRGGGAIRR